MSVVVTLAVSVVVTVAVSMVVLVDVSDCVSGCHVGCVSGCHSGCVSGCVEPYLHMARADRAWTRSPGSGNHSSSSSPADPPRT